MSLWRPLGMGFRLYPAELNGQLVRIRAMSENVDHGDKDAIVVPLYKYGVR